MATNHVRLWALGAFAALATGCAQFKAGPYGSDYQALDRLKASKPATVAIGAVQPTDPQHKVNNLSLRGAALVSPSGTFSKYLEDALASDLKEISVLDPASKTRLDATIAHNEINVAGFTVGTGAMEVELTVARDGRQRLRKKYQANTTFESSFAGNVAIPAGQAAYGGLVRELLKTVYSDPQFIAAIGK
ncbi:hypothetical protein [Ramlibacter tataouinensis]|uniref:Lipoprotein n=1 Tax=Ramlibacter tataouinensis (strain ATCC BAA-407 / DSM 14655 / LMG 21543 / TTB310) TaxID=365046 RepID=F5Y309_RAMTT|nr:hypothetical protein [Ramlibacter tataouinensis]AEG94889.1 hypothetical protein Rta_37740 [Ramlibacter tataouinensis TTB310]